MTGICSKSLVVHLLSLKIDDVEEKVLGKDFEVINLVLTGFQSKKCRVYQDCSAVIRMRDKISETAQDVSVFGISFSR